MTKTTTGLAIALACGVAQGAMAEQLILTSLGPAGSDNSTFFNAWAAEVNAAAGGSIEIVVRDGSTIANFGNLVDRVQSDVVQIGWTIPSAIGGRFPTIDAPGLPGVQLGLTNEEGSLAAWELYESGVLDAELAGLKVLSISVTAPDGLHCAQAPASDDLSTLTGLKVGVSDGLNADVLSALGAVPVSLGFFDFYESLQRGTVDCILTSYAPLDATGISEVTRYHIEGPFSAKAVFVVMDQARFDSLPEAARVAIDAASGAALVSRVSAHFDAQDQTGLRLLQEGEGHTIRQLTEAEQAVWLERGAAAAIDNWIAATPGGAEVLDTYRGIIAQD